jgi:hypothetical protein
MKFYSSFVLSEFGPPEDAQTDVNGGGIQRIHMAINFDFKIVFIAALAGFGNHDVGKLFEDFVTTLFVGFVKISA